MRTAKSETSAKDRPPAPKGKKAEQKVHRVMSEFKEGELHSSSGEPVTKRAQAVAIALSEARRAGKKKT